MTGKTLKNYIKQAGELAREIDALTRKYNHIRNDIINAMDAQGLTQETGGRVRATLSRFDETRLNASKLKTDAPYIYKQFSETRAQTRLTIRRVDS